MRLGPDLARSRQGRRIYPIPALGCALLLTDSRAVRVGVLAERSGKLRFLAKLEWAGDHAVVATDRAWLHTESVNKVAELLHLADLV